MYIATDPAATIPPGTPKPEARYVTMPDGTELAVDIWAADGAPPSATIVWFTRYWRRAVGVNNVSDTYRDAIAYFTAAGYAFVVVDVRGTGASFGSRSSEWAPQELEDYGTVIDWIATQPWSNGAVATMGISYPGNAAELAVIAGSSALRAVVPRFTDFTEYLHAFRPGGLVNTVIGRTWIELTQALDRNNDPAYPELADTLGPGDSVAPVDGDDGTMLNAAVAEHRGNADLRGPLAVLEHADDPFGLDATSPSLEDISASGHWPAIDAQRVPSMHWASWYDGGTAESVITRFLTFESDMVGVIGAWNHGGSTNADPFGARGDAPPEPSRASQYAAIERFLRPLMGPVAGPAPDRVLEYFTVGANLWRTTTSWPPPGHAEWSLFLHEGGALTEDEPTQAGSDTHLVDDSETSGVHNRWHTQLGATVEHGDRRHEDTRLLTYDTAPLTADVELTGTPVVQLQLSLDGPDAALHVYLEIVSPGGVVTAISDGNLRVSFAGTERTDATYPGPTPTFVRAGRREFAVGSPRSVIVTLRPLSALVRRSHRIRLAIAGADADTFLPLLFHQSSRRIDVQRGGDRRSWIVLPRIESGALESPSRVVSGS